MLHLIPIIYIYFGLSYPLKGKICGFNSLWILGFDLLRLDSETIFTAY